MKRSTILCIIIATILLLSVVLVGYKSAHDGTGIIALQDEYTWRNFDEGPSGFNITPTLSGATFTFTTEVGGFSDDLVYSGEGPTQSITVESGTTVGWSGHSYYGFADDNWAVKGFSVTINVTIEKNGEQIGEAVIVLSMPDHRRLVGEVTECTLY